MGYSGAASIAALQKAQLTKITKAGMTESHAYDTEITKKVLNYTR